MDLAQLDMQIKVSAGLHSCFGGAEGESASLSALVTLLLLSQVFLMTARKDSTLKTHGIRLGPLG